MTIIKFCFDRSPSPAEKPRPADPKKLGELRPVLTGHWLAGGPRDKPRRTPMSDTPWRRQAEARAAGPAGRLGAERRYPASGRSAPDLWLPEDRHAPQARAAIRRRGPDQHQARLPADEDARPNSSNAIPVGDDPAIMTARWRQSARTCAGARTVPSLPAGNDEVARVAFALDYHDREVIGWVATTAGISGEMIRGRRQSNRIDRRADDPPARPRRSMPQARATPRMQSRVSACKPAE